MAKTFNSQNQSPVATHRITGVTSTSPAKIHKVPRGSAVKIYPTSAGTATVYSTNTPQKVSVLDTSNADIVASNNANWDVWEAGIVSSATLQTSTVPVETVTLAVTTGTWTIEITI